MSSGGGNGAAAVGTETEAGDGFGSDSGSERRVHIMVEYCEPCGFGATYEELASAVREEYPDIEIESRLGGTGAFEIEINGQLVFSKLENGGFPYEKDSQEWGTAGEDHQQPPPLHHPVALRPVGVSCPLSTPCFTAPR
uniref:Migration and invasion enhancer 1 n=1 Tax=Gallus gallus TaxID=9031 RepID=A0A8V1A258_CHICK